MSLAIADNLVVKIHYTLKDNDGNLLDSSEGSEPLAYLHGAGNIIPGLEKALLGKTEGDSMQVKIEPEDGYGQVNPELVMVVDKENFQGIEGLEPGMMMQAQAPNGAMQIMVVKKVEADKVTIDANHPMAGVTLNFDVKVVKVREASAEELDHGHVHEHGHAH